MLKSVETVLEKPLLYKKTEGEFWNDEHISKQMLKAHYFGNWIKTVLPINRALFLHTNLLLNVL